VLSYTRAGRYAVLSIGQTDRRPLDRFARAVRAGRVSGPISMQSPHRPSKKPQYRFYLYGAEELWRVAKLLLPYLGAVKRARIIRLLSLVLARSRPPGDMNTVSSTTATPASGRIQLAWAAGFFDGEGCFSLSRATSYPCVSITQRKPQVLLRFADAVGFGKLCGPYRHRTPSLSDKEYFLPRAHGYPKVEALAAMLWFRLGPAKREQAAGVLATWPRTCRRGHPFVPGHSGAQPSIGGPKGVRSTRSLKRSNPAVSTYRAVGRLLQGSRWVGG
jgi:hypothetical protein